MFKDIAWNSFYKTGDINSFLEYTKLKQIESGENGIENLDYKNLAEDLIENELSS